MNTVLRRIASWLWPVRLVEPLKNLVVFLVGGVLSVALSRFLQGQISLPDAALALCGSVAAIAIVFYVAALGSRISILADSVEKTVHDVFVSVDYIDEMPQGSPGWRGLTYKRLAELCAGAEFEVLALVEIVSQGSQFASITAQERKSYLSTLEKTLWRNRRDFRYVRIFQLPPAGSQPFSVASHLDRLTGEHCQRSLALAARAELADRSSRLSVSIKEVRSQRLQSILIIDRRYVLIEIDGITSTDEPYFSGMVVLDDRSGIHVDKFRNYFQSVSDSLARPVTAAELSQAVGRPQP